MTMRLMAIATTALLASGLLMASAQAHGGGFGGGGHMGGFGGGAHFGGIGAGAGMGGHGHAIAGLHHHRLNGFGIGDDDCFDWQELHPTEPLPLSCD